MFKLFGNSKIKRQLSADTKKLHSYLAALFLKVDNYALSSTNNFLSDNGIKVSSRIESIVVNELKRNAKNFSIEQEKLKLLQEDYFSKVSYYPVERNDWKIEDLEVHKKELDSILRSVYWPSLPYDVEGDFWKFCSSKKCIEDRHFQRLGFRPRSLHHVLYIKNSFTWETSATFLISMQFSGEDFYLCFEERMETGEWSEEKIFTFCPYDMSRYLKEERTVIRNLEQFLTDKTLPKLDREIKEIVIFLTKGTDL